VLHRAETIRSALEVLAVCTVIPKAQLQLCEQVRQLDTDPVPAIRFTLGFPIIRPCTVHSSVVGWLNSMRVMCIYTVSQKNVPPLTCYNLDIHDPITIILAEVLLRK